MRALSIITVCKEAGARIDRTAATLRLPPGLSWEWVVVDGASIDDTVARAETWRGRLSGELRVVSEPDGGIYDAMNKGLRLACGEWVWFLNAGDSLIPGGAARAMSVCARTASGLVTAQVRLADPFDGYLKTVGGPFGWDRVARAEVPPHQAVFFRREKALRQGGHDTRFGLAADAHLILRMAGMETGAEFVAEEVAVYPNDGVSSRFDPRFRMLRDKARAIRAVAPRGVANRARWALGVQAVRAAASRLLQAVGLLREWRRLKTRVGGG